MSYFNHAFQKAFVGTGGYNGNTVNSTTAGLTPSSTPQFAFYDQNYNGVDLGNIVAGESNCCPLILASASFRTSDMIGPYHGGYQESNKSKVINPKYVTKFYRVDNCDVQQAQVLVGQTNLSFENPACCKEFLCDETYYLRVDIKGSPALEFLTRNAYLTADAYTGCCADPAAAPTAVNPLIVYVQWAYNLLRNQTINPFISVTPTYTTDNGVNWTAIGDGTSSAANLQTLLDFITGVTPYPAVSDCVTDPTHGAGLIIDGAYVDTRFADCTFYPTDGTKAFLEPVVVLASEVDFNGDPCAFTGICVVDQCDPIQLKGSGEKVIREVMLTEAYRQQPTHTGKDLRIREITGGTDIFTAIPRNAFYTRYFIEHVVPRFNNPSGVFDNDRYLLEIVANPTVTTFVTAPSITNAPAVADETGIGIGDVVYLNGVDTTLTVTGLGPLTLSGNIVVAEGDVLTFLEANLHEFEVDVNGWLACANGGQECVQLEIINCNGICTPADPEVIVEGIG